MVKKLLISLIALILLCSNGCLLMQEADFNAVNDSVKLLSQRTDEFQIVMQEAANTGLANAEKVAEINKDVDEYQKILLIATEAIKDSPTIIDAAIKTNQISAPVNPYAPIIDAVLKIIAASGVIGTGIATRRVVQVVKEKKIVEKKYKANNRANEAIRIKHPDIAEEHYNLVGSERERIGV